MCCKVWVGMHEAVVVLRVDPWVHIWVSGAGHCPQPNHPPAAPMSSDTRCTQRWATAVACHLARATSAAFVWLW